MKGEDCEASVTESGVGYSRLVALKQLEVWKYYNRGTVIYSKEQFHPLFTVSRMVDLYIYRIHNHSCGSSEFEIKVTQTCTTHSLKSQTP